MSFVQYCKDKWISIFIFVMLLMIGGGLLWLIEVPPAVAFIIEGVYMAGFFVILLQDYFHRKSFYGNILETVKDLDEICYLSELLSEPDFQEGRILYDILHREENYMNNKIAQYQQELKEYQDYVETWVHEIKTPIAVSRMVTQNHRGELTASLMEEMDKIEGLVGQMLYYSKSGSLHEDYMLREVMLRELVVKAVKDQSKAMVANHIMPKFEQLDVKVLTDSKWMDFILGQVLSNAIKYRTQHGKSEIRFWTEQSGKNLTLHISDNGIGIPKEDVERVFAKGFTGENGRKYSKSTGMGLYLCKVLCQKMGSEISISSKEGEGTDISISLVLA